MQHAKLKNEEKERKRAKRYLSVNSLVEFEKEATGSNPLSFPSCKTEGWGSLM